MEVKIVAEKHSTIRQAHDEHGRFTNEWYDTSKAYDIEPEEENHDIDNEAAALRQKLDRDLLHYQTLQTEDDRIEMIKQVTDLVYASPVEQVEKAQLLSQWHALASIHVDDETWSEVHNRHLIHDALPKILGPELYAQVGTELQNALKDKPLLIEKIIDKDPHSLLAELPFDIGYLMTQHYVDTGLLKETKTGKLKLKKSNPDLTLSATKNANLSANALAINEKTDSLKQVYERDHKKSAIDTFEVSTNQSGARILYLTEMLVGHRAFDKDFFDSVIDSIKSLPENERPTTIVMSGIIQGDFKTTQSKRKMSLAIEKMDQQFSEAKKLIDAVRELGIAVIYSYGSQDRKLAEDYTLDVMQTLHTNAEDNSFIPYYQANQLRQHPSYTTHLNFQYDVALPYCLRNGRRLRTAQEMQEISGDKEAIDEYLMLFNAYQNMMQNGQMPDEWSHLIDKETFLPSATSGELMVFDDVDIITQTNNKSYTTSFRDNPNYSANSLPANHMKNSKELLGYRAANAMQSPHTLASSHNKEALYFTEAGTDVLSTPSMLDTSRALSQKGRYTNIPGDHASQANKQRRRPLTPGVIMHEQTDDGRTISTYFNDDLNERSFSLPERMVIFELNDLQIGSLTARPDLQVKYVDYILETARESPVAIQVGGDIIHGNLYPNFHNESQSVGMISLPAQKQAMKLFLRDTFAGVDETRLNAFVDILVQPGNHEWNNGAYKKPGNGEMHVDYLKSEFETILQEGGGDKNIVRNGMMTNDGAGTPLPIRGGFSSYGEYGTYIEHYHIERGAKGSMGGLPVYQGYDKAKGLGEMFEDTNIIFGGHWHNPQSAVIGNKLITVGGALAQLSEFEYNLGYKAIPAANAVHIGGAKPVQVETIHAAALLGHEVKNGMFTNKNLAEEGYYDDDNFDPIKHGPYSPDTLPKSAIQKRIRANERRASQLTDFETHSQNPNIYDDKGNFVSGNLATQKLAARALR